MRQTTFAERRRMHLQLRAEQLRLARQLLGIIYEQTRGYHRVVSLRMTDAGSVILQTRPR